MNPQPYYPFRMMTSEQAQGLEQDLRARLEQFIDTYACQTVEISISNEASSTMQDILWQNQEGDPLLYSSSNLSLFMCELAVNDTDSHYQQALSALSFLFMEHLTGQSLTRLERHPTQKPVPCVLFVHLKTQAGHALHLGFTPFFVASCYPVKASPTPLSLRPVALEGHPIEAELRLKPARLSVESLQNLKVGQLLVCDHAIDEPIFLCVDQKPIANVTLHRHQNRYVFQRI